MATVKDRTCVWVGGWSHDRRGLVAACTDCGLLTDVVDPAERERLQRVAYRHAEAGHDGDVDREGWV